MGGTVPAAVGPRESGPTAVWPADVGELTLAGARLTEIDPLVPLAADQALGVAVSTFGGTAHVGLHADHDAVPDLDQLGSHLEGALVDLLEA